MSHCIDSYNLDDLEKRTIASIHRGFVSFCFRGFDQVLLIYRENLVVFPP